MAVEKNPATEAPVAGQLVDYSALETRTRSMQDAGIWVEAPASARMTSLARTRWVKLAMAQGLGTDKPKWALVIPDPEKKSLFFVPWKEEHPSAVEVRYYRNGARMNLTPVFTYLGRILDVGSREFFPVKLSERPVKVGEMTVNGLVMPLKREAKRYEKKESKERAAARRAQKAQEAKAAKATKEAAAPSEQPK